MCREYTEHSNYVYVKSVFMSQTSYIHACVFIVMCVWVACLQNKNYTYFINHLEILWHESKVDVLWLCTFACSCVMCLLWKTVILITDAYCCMDNIIYRCPLRMPLILAQLREYFIRFVHNTALLCSNNQLFSPAILLPSSLYSNT